MLDFLSQTVSGPLASGGSLEVWVSRPEVKEERSSHVQGGPHVSRGDDLLWSGGW